MHILVYKTILYFSPFSYSFLIFKEVLFLRKYLLESIFYFSFFFLAEQQHMEFLGQGSDLIYNCSNVRSFISPFQAGDWTCVLSLQRCHWSHFATRGTLLFFFAMFFLFGLNQLKITLLWLLGLIIIEMVTIFRAFLILA